MCTGSACAWKGNNMDKYSVMEKLSSLHAVSGYEFAIGDKIANMFSEYCDEVQTDNLGNVMGIMRSKNADAGSIMVEAHIDEIGLMITDIDDDGFLHFTNIGGIDSRILLAKEVVIHGSKDIIGVIGARPPHITTAEERSKTVPTDKLCIDTGLCADELREVVSVGDTVTFADSFAQLGKKYVSAKSQDDRTGVAVMIFVMQKLKNYDLPFNVYFCACVQEEVGRRGVAAAANAIDPVFAIAVDVCHASTPDASQGTFKPGSGTVVSKGPNIHPLLLDYALEIMDENNISYNIEVDSDDTGTDAWAIQTARMGIPTMLFSLPLKYMHTMVETVHMDDVIATANAIYSLIVNTNDAEAVVCWN